MTTRSKHTAAVAGVAAIVAGVTIVGGVVLPATAVEIAVDDFRVSSMGPDGAIGYEAQQPKVAYSPDSDQYLVVWRGDHEGDGQAEIYGQLVDARTSLDVSAEFVVARIGAAGDDSTDAIEPAVVWSGTQQEFVVAFTGDPDDRDTDQIVSDSFEIYAQRVTIAGLPAGAPLRSTPTSPTWPGTRSPTNCSWCGRATTPPTTRPRCGASDSGTRVATSWRSVPTTSASARSAPTP
jgi:hypothetical protein